MQTNSPVSSLLRTPRSLVPVLLGLASAACAPESFDDPHRDPWLNSGPTPRSATAAASSVLSLGAGTSCATTPDGEAVCWGQGGQGRLGQGAGSTLDQPDPSTLVRLDLDAPAVEVVTNGEQAYALLDDGRVQAFGRNDQGQLGLGHTWTIGDDETPAGATVLTIVPLAGPARQIGAGDGFACVRLDDGRVQCWGRGDLGQLGRGVQPGGHGPDDVMLGGLAVELVVGGRHACARLQGGAVRCWGDDTVGQLGYGSQGVTGAVPADRGDVPVGGAAVALAAGGAHTCAILDVGALRCWGGNAHGQLGLGHAQSIGDDETPAQAGAVELGGPVSAVVAGRQHTCALPGDGSLRCWGAGTYLQHGLAQFESVGDDELPLAVAAVDFGASAVEAVFSGALAEHTCAELDDGRLRCWGRNDHGQVGLGLASVSDPAEGPPGDLPDVIIVDDSEE